MPRFVPWAFAAAVLLSELGFAQSLPPGGGRARTRPSLADRLGNFGRNLVGETAPPQIATRPQRPVHSHPAPNDLVEEPQPPAATSTAPGGRSSRRTAQPRYTPSPERPTESVAARPRRRPVPAEESEPISPAEQPSPVYNDRAASPEDSASQTEPTPFDSAPAEVAGESEAATPMDGEGVVEDGSAADASAESAVPATATPAEPRVARGGLRPHRPMEPAAPPTQIDTDVLMSLESPVLGVQTAGPRTIKVGQPATYHVRVANAGRAAAQDVVVVVRVPEWAEVRDARAPIGQTRLPGSDGAIDGVHWTLREVPPQSTADLLLEIVPQKSRPFDLNVEWTQSAVTSVAKVEVQEAKLVMAISGPDEVQFGHQETYKLTLSNPGSGDAEDVVVRLLPTTPGDTETAMHRVGPIAAGETKTIELELTARDPGRLVISAEAAGAGGLRTSATTDVLVRRAELQTSFAGPRKMFAGATATYKVRVANPGNAPAKNVEIAAIAPAGAKFLAASDGGRIEAAEGKIVWRIASLPAGTEHTLSMKCRLETAGPNRPQVVCTADDDLKTAATATTEVEAMADLALTVSDPSGPVPVGEDAEYEVRIVNRGKKAADGVECVAFFSEGIEPVEASGARSQLGPGQVTFDRIGAIEAGQEIVLSIRARASQAGDHIFRAQVRCQTLNSALAAEETTRFYESTDGADDTMPPTAEPTEGDGAYYDPASEPAAEGSDATADEAAADDGN